VARATDAAIAAAILALVAGCGSRGSGSSPDASKAKTQQHITGRTHPGGNTNKGE
jgi:predicted small lipoprotein YifL